MTAMNVPNGAKEPQWKRFLTPWKIAAVLIAAFLISQAYFSWQDSFLGSALENSPTFVTPEFPLDIPSGCRDFSLPPKK